MTPFSVLRERAGDAAGNLILQGRVADARLVIQRWDAWYERQLYGEEAL